MLLFSQSCNLLYIILVIPYILLVKWKVVMLVWGNYFVSMPFQPLIKDIQQVDAKFKRFGYCCLTLRVSRCFQCMNIQSTIVLATIQALIVLFRYDLRIMFSINHIYSSCLYIYIYMFLKTVIASNTYLIHWFLLFLLFDILDSNITI